MILLSESCLSSTHSCWVQQTAPPGVAGLCGADWCNQNILIRAIFCRNQSELDIKVRTGECYPANDVCRISAVHPLTSHQPSEQYSWKRTFAKFEVSQSWRRPILGSSLGLKHLLAFSHLRIYQDTMLNRCLQDIPCISPKL